jgi:hypothetical protein
VTAPNVTLPPDPLDALDAGDPFAGAGVPDPIGAAVFNDPVVAGHVATMTAAGIEAARGALSRLRIEAVSAAENAAAPYVKLRADADLAFKSGRYHERFGNDGALAQRAYDVEKAGIDRDRAAAVKDAVTGLRERLATVVSTIATEAARADEPAALTPEQSRAMTDVLTLLPHLSVTEQLAQLEAVVATATAAPTAERRAGLRHVLPLLRSLAERPEFARTTDAGVRLYVVAQRAAALTRDHRYYAAEAMRRYAGAFEYELGLVEAAVVEHGAWHGSHAANRQTLDGRGVLRVAIAPPAKDAPSRWQRTT